MEQNSRENQTVIQDTQAKASRTQAEIKAAARKEAKVSNRFAVLALPEITDAADRHSAVPCQCANADCAGSCNNQV